MMIEMIRICQIELDRKWLLTGKLAEKLPSEGLIVSLKAMGQEEPITVQLNHATGKYMVVDGARRYLAFLILGKDLTCQKMRTDCFKVACVVKTD